MPTASRILETIPSNHRHPRVILSRLSSEQSVSPPPLKQARLLPSAAKPIDFVACLLCDHVGSSIEIDAHLSSHHAVRADLTRDHLEDNVMLRRSFPYRRDCNGFRRDQRLCNLCPRPRFVDRVSYIWRHMRGRHKIALTHLLEVLPADEVRLYMGEPVVDAVVVTAVDNVEENYDTASNFPAAEDSSVAEENANSEPTATAIFISNLENPANKIDSHPVSVDSIADAVSPAPTSEVAATVEPQIDNQGHELSDCSVTEEDKVDSSPRHQKQTVRIKPRLNVKCKLCKEVGNSNEISEHLVSWHRASPSLDRLDMKINATNTCNPKGRRLCGVCSMDEEGAYRTVEAADYVEKHLLDFHNIECMLLRHLLPHAEFKKYFILGEIKSLQVTRFSPLL